MASTMAIEIETITAPQSAVVTPSEPSGWDSNDGPASTAPLTSTTRVDHSLSDDAPTNRKPSVASTAFIMLPLCLSTLLSALDITIVIPAIPTIVGSLGSVAGYTWIGSAFILASTATTPLWGTVADIWGRKPIILLAIAIFLGGSLLCALAPDMDALIAGRVVQGLGSAGMGTMVNVIICDSFSVRDRGLYLGITSLAHALGSAIGPLVGGALTDKADWRWCFWINLPIGGTVLVILLFFLKVANPGTPILAGLKKIDWAGGSLVMGSVLMVLLALDFGDVVFPWSSATVICLLVFGVVCGALFVVNEWKFAKEPIIPLHLFSRKSSVAAYGVYVFNFYVFIGMLYYLPLYSQAVLGANALDSGIYIIPLIVASSLAAAFVGFFIQKTGRYLGIMYIGQFLSILGVGLLVYLPFEKSLARLFIFEILVGVGCGMNIEPPLIAVQAVNSERDSAAVVSSMNFARSIAIAVSIVVGGVIFQNEMAAANPGLVTQIGAELGRQFNGDQASAKVEVINELPDQQQGVVRQAYFHSLRDVWIMYVAFSGLSLLLNVFVRAHHLSTENKGAVLGADREKTIGTDDNVELRRRLPDIMLDN
ncbi:major facilitator superfamily domain-containing protein [Daldinia decipiens]|uniref:major facilitator superfamily domain-containing protein n=1 Tax=Daldinia decipiens TaxID=326647 RepID=UPI0020C46B51|nr:major facilitator superfamily domain-containing protein [Daldinia decipiens]KAI1662857.1 major facilitator superfamily domain-containing protein [Daldinia decipiens]